MRIEQYFLMTDYSPCDVILNGDSHILTRVIDGVVQPVAPTTAEQRDAKTLMEAIEKRFGGNKETKKCDGVGSCDWRFQAEEEPTNYALMAFASTSSCTSDNEMISSDSDVSMPASLVYDSYKSGKGYHAIPHPYTGTFMTPKPDLVFHDAPTINETVHTAFNVELSPTKLDKDLSQSNRPSALLIKDWVSDLEDESEGESKHTQTEPSFVQPTEHVKTPRPSVKTGEHSIPAANLRKDIPKSRGHENSWNRKACFVSKTVGTKTHSPPRRIINHRPSPQASNFLQKVITVKALQVNAVKGVQGNWIQVSYGLDPKETLTFLFVVSGNPQHALKDKGVIDSGCSRHMTGNMSYLSDFKEINGGYVAFGGNPKGGEITGKGKIRTDTECIILSSNFKLPDDNHVLLRVLRENNMYNVDLKNIIPSGDWTCIFAKFCGMKGIKREFSVARTPQQNGIAKRKNRALIEAARTMLADSLLPIPFWAEAVNTACYVQNKVLVTKPHNKTPYELLLGRTPSIGFMRPFGCLVTILNTLDPLGKFDGKADEGFLVRYSVSSKAFRVFNSKTQIVQETLHIIFLENKPNVAGSGPTWLFDIDTLKTSMNYQPVFAGNQPNLSAGIQEHFDSDKAGEGNVQQYVLFPLWSFGSKDLQNTDDDTTFEVKKPEFKVKKPESEVHVSPSSSAMTNKHDAKTKIEARRKSPVEFTLVPAVEQISTNSTNTFSAAGPSNTVVSPTHGKYLYVDPSQYPDDPNMPALEDITYSNDEEDIGAEADFSNLETTITVSPIPTTRVHKNHHEEGIDYEQVFAPVARIEPIRLFLAYTSFMGFMVYKIDVKSAFLYGTIKEEVYVCQPPGFEDPDYPDKVYKVVKALYGLHQAPRAWYKTLANYLLENGFQKGKIDQTLFIKKQKGDILLVQVYVDDIIFGSTNKDLCKAFEKLMKYKFQMSLMGELTFFLGLQVKQKPDGIFISQDKYVAEILRKFGFTDGKSASTLIDT
nr:putative ribonuclease H-like domain-containing protein [Tanacetum cinerariifolium]